MAVCSTTALRKYLTQRSNLGQPLREKAVSTTRGHAEGEALITSGAYRRPLFKSSLTKPLPEAVHQRLAEPWSRVARAAAQVLRHTSLALPARRSPPTLDPVIEAIAAYEAVVDDIRRTGITRDLPNEAVGRVFALGFVLEQFRRNLGDLLSRTREAQSADAGTLEPS